MSNRVLLIEDEISIRSMYSEVLREEDYEVTEIGDGRDGYDAVMAGEWDILLLDIMLPRLDGIELLKKVRSDPSTNEKPIVILTNLEDARIKETCFDLGIKDFLVKSNIMPNDVVLTVKKYVFNE